MGKAKQFIRENTKKTYNYNSYEMTPTPWLTPDQALRAVEIAREEMFEKVCEFLDNNLYCYIKAQDFALENDIKQAMKDE